MTTHGVLGGLLVILAPHRGISDGEVTMKVSIELDAEQWDMVRCAMQSMTNRLMENAYEDSDKDESLATMWHEAANKAYDIARIVARSIGMDAEVW